MKCNEYTVEHFTIEAFIRFVYIINKNRRSYLISLLQYFFNPPKRIANLFISISHFTQVVFDIMITWKLACVNNIINDIIYMYLLNAATNFNNFRMDASEENDSIQQRPKSNNSWI